MEGTIEILKCNECNNSLHVKIKKSKNKTTVICSSCGRFAGDSNDLINAVRNWNEMNN